MTRQSLRWPLLSFMLLLLALPLASWAQQSKKDELQLRTVHGTVVDKDENPVASAIIYLMNVKTQVVKTYIADEEGKYRFSGLDPNADFEIHAEKGDFTSAVRKISSYDNRKDIPLFLKLDKKKPPK